MRGREQEEEALWAALACLHAVEISSPAWRCSGHGDGWAVADWLCEEWVLACCWPSSLPRVNTIKYLIRGID